MLARLVRHLSGRPDRPVLLLRYLLRSRKCCLHLHELDMKRFLRKDCLLQNLDSVGNRISCSCRSSSLHALQQTLVMPQSRCDVLFAGTLQICSVSEDSSFLFHRTVTSTIPAFGPTPSPTLALFTCPFFLLPSTFLRHCSREAGSAMYRNFLVICRCRAGLTQTQPSSLSPFPESSVPRRTAWMSHHGANGNVRTDSGTKSTQSSHQPSAWTIATHTHREWIDTNVPGVQNNNSKP